MRVFPQLNANTAAQFPMAVTRQWRTVVNRLTGGQLIRYSDPGVRRTVWTLEFRGLDDVERATLEAFFRSVEGRLLTFTYLDPQENLLSDSESLDGPAWVSAPGLSVTAGLAGALGGAGAALLSNASPLAGSLTQTIPIPGWFHYSWSIYLRADVETEVSLGIRTLGGEVASTYAVDTEWRRAVISGNPIGLGESIEVEVVVPSGAAIEACAPQLEPHPAASPYKPSPTASAVHGNARFLHDEIVWRSPDPNVHHTSLRIASN